MSESRRYSRKRGDKHKHKIRRRAYRRKRAFQRPVNRRRGNSRAAQNSHSRKNTFQVSRVCDTFSHCTKKHHPAQSAQHTQRCFRFAFHKLPYTAHSLRKRENPRIIGRYLFAVEIIARFIGQRAFKLVPTVIEIVCASRYSATRHQKQSNKQYKKLPHILPIRLSST